MATINNNYSQQFSSKEGFIQVKGGRVWYKVLGIEKAKTPILCLHGGPGATHDYMQPLEKLADDRPVIFYDQLGSGNSDRPADKSLWTLERFVDELSIVRKELQLNNVHILAQSWGTTLLVDYLLMNKPDGIRSIILDGPCIDVDRWIADQKKYLLELPEKVQNAVAAAETSRDYSSAEYQEAMNEFYKRHLCRLEEWPDYVMRTFEKMGADVYNHMWGPSEFSVTGILKNHNRSDRLKEINLPAKFICGEFDEATPQTTGFYSSMMPGSEFYVIKDSSHMHHVEKQDEYISIVNDFISRNE